eukprot:517936-Hanusia_phi.AAC.1
MRAAALGPTLSPGAKLIIMASGFSQSDPRLRGTVRWCYSGTAPGRRLDTLTRDHVPLTESVTWGVP